MVVGFVWDKVGHGAICSGRTGSTVQCDFSYAHAVLDLTGRVGCTMKLSSTILRKLY